MGDWKSNCFRGSFRGSFNGCSRIFHGSTRNFQNKKRKTWTLFQLYHSRPWWLLVRVSLCSKSRKQFYLPLGKPRTRTVNAKTVHFCQFFKFPFHLKDGFTVFNRLGKNHFTISMALNGRN